MLKNIFIGIALLSSLILTSCASVPMASQEENFALKQFAAPPADKSNLYVYRDTFVGQALKKNVYLDGEFIGETANKIYFFKTIDPGQHTLSTESEFSDNALSFLAIGGKNYFAEQYIKMGLFVGGANVKMVDEKEGMEAVRECDLAK